MNKKKISILLLISVFILVSCGKNTTNKNLNTENSSTKNSNSTDSMDKEGFDKGNLAPDFKVKLLSGETVKLSDYKDKVVLLNFWATWCSPCQYEMPDLQKLHDEYGEKLVVLAINLGESENTISDYIEKNKFSFKVGIDEMAKIKYPIIGLPSTFLLNKEGRIEYFGEGIPSEDVYTFYKEKIDKLI